LDAGGQLIHRLPILLGWAGGRGVRWARLRAPTGSLCSVLHSWSMEAPRQPEATRTEGFAPAVVSQSHSAASQACPCSGEVGSMTQRAEAAWHYGRSFAQQTLRNTVRSAPWCLSCGDCARTHCSLTWPLTGNGEETAIIRCAAGQSHADGARTAVTSHCSRAPPPISTRRTPGGRHGRTGQDRPRCFPTEAVF
jgi:hypothetical protein